MSQHIPSEADVFISYNHRNSDWVRELLVPTLEAANVKLWLDVRNFEPGAPILTEIERAVLNSRKTLIVLTPAYLTGEWTEFENILSQSLDPAARQRRVLPLLLEPCEIPLRLCTLIYLDFTERARYETEFRRLLQALGATAPTAVATPARANAREDEIKNLKRRRLHELRKKQALMGINTPPDVLIEIEDLTHELER
ncbi:MAG: toll/interleukin-1 receptor domain-containing protein [Chloroflexi bacterium]|nr:toll/interleukin-1 receptor domain-containing protein [Chloroflexota bacterium]